jgi:putative two-component system response regulator
MLPKKILVIDDERIIRYTTSVLLRKKGVVTVEAETGASGLALAKSELPELILLDIMMPDMDGWSILQKLREDPVTASIPVVMFSASDYAETSRRAAGKGLHGILRKPFQLGELLSVCDMPERRL